MSWGGSGALFVRRLGGVGAAARQEPRPTFKPDGSPGIRRRQGYAGQARSPYLLTEGSGARLKQTR